MVTRWVVALPLVVAVACSHPQLGPGEIYNSQVITEDEIAASHASNAFDVIHKLRANFLTVARPASIARPPIRTPPFISTIRSLDRSVLFRASRRHRLR